MLKANVRGRITFMVELGAFASNFPSSPTAPTMLTALLGRRGKAAGVVSRRLCRVAPQARVKSYAVIAHAGRYSPLSAAPRAEAAAAYALGGLVYLWENRVGATTGKTCRPAIQGGYRNRLLFWR